MKLPVHVLAWSLTSYPSLASKILENEVLDKDMDAAAYVEMQGSVYRDQDLPQRFERTKGNIGRDESAAHLEPDRQKAHHPSNDIDSGNLHLYRAGGPSTGLADGSGVSIEGSFLMFSENNAKGESMPRGRRSRDSRRVSRQRRNTKGAKSTSSKTKSSKSSKSSNRILPNGCVQGSSEFVTEACKSRNCCQGYFACQWPDYQISTICPDSCNGGYACYYIGDGTFIDRGSCNAEGDNGSACASFSDYTKSGKSSIGKNSCNGERACFIVCVSSELCVATIGDDACNGHQDCFGIGFTQVNYGNFQIESVTVGDGSCSSYGTSLFDGLACQSLGAMAKSIKIGKASCLAQRACFRLGYNSFENVEIGDGSCTDTKSCLRVGYNAEGTSTVSIGDDSCTNEDACRQLGAQTIEKVEIGDDACTDFRSCFYFGEQVTQVAVAVDDDQCQLMTECAGDNYRYRYNTACQTTAMVPNDDGLCPLS